MNKEENWQKEYWKLWGHLKDTPMAKNIYSFIRKIRQEAVLEALEKVMKIIEPEIIGKNAGYDRLAGRLEKKINKLRKYDQQTNNRGV